MYLRVLKVAAFVLVFLTSFRLFAAAPTVTTQAASSITTSSAVLNGTGVPNGEQTTGWFRISATNPGACDDVFGTRVPAAGGTDLGAGVGNVPYSITTTGLTSGVTYYFCPIVQNASATAFGTIMSFTVPGAPVVTTTGTSNVTSSSAVLEGTGNPVAASATGWFRYSTTDPGTCNDSFGTRAPSSGGTNLGAGNSPVAYTRSIGSLTPGMTYYYCAIVQNAHGTSFGAVLTFNALAVLPAVSTTGATLLTGTTAQLNGSANPGGAATTGWFRYSTTNPVTCDDVFGTRAPSSGGSSLGNGNTAVVYALGVTGLTPSTTYYYCAIANNTIGNGFGSVQSFTTPSLPTVTTLGASGIGNTSALLEGQASPNGAATTGYFRYHITDPGTCNDSFGSRAPVSGGSTLGGGTSPVYYSQSITGLSPATTYYYCAIANNSQGTAFGAVLTFVTAAAPTATTAAQTLVTSSSATLNGSGDPNGNNAYGYYRYSASNPGVCTDGFGTRAPTSSFNDSGLGAGTSDVAFSRSITGLTPATTYYYCAIVYNSYGTAYGAVLSFTTLANPPSVSTSSATLLTGTTAQLNGSANPGGAATTGWFRYATASPGTCNDSFGTRAPAAGGSSLGFGNTSVPYSQGVTGLTAGVTYYYCAIAQNSVGTQFGSVVQFTTPIPPQAITSSISSVSNTSATLQGQGNPNGSLATGWFRYSATNPMTCDDMFGSRAPASGGANLGSGYGFNGYGQSISGLTAGTTYYYCAIVSTFEGTAFGVVQSFTTPTVPGSTTVAATAITSSSATFNGLGDPNGDVNSGAYGYFRYGTTDPGTCSDAFGSRWPSSMFSDTYLGTGTADVPYGNSIGSLSPGTTYYFCAVARNGYGTTFGSVLSFTTLANAPSVSTNSVSLLTSSTATLNGTANPGGAATTGWFRYSTTNPGACNDSFGTRAPAAGGTALGSGISSTPFSQAVTGLAAATTYYYCAIAQNSVATGFGSVVTFTTPTPPTVTTITASSLTNTSAYLEGSANPNGSATTGYFRYALTDPVTCDDSFGSRAPASGGSNLGAGNSVQFYGQSITGLSAATTYYYCAIASSLEGKAFGAVMSFTTPTQPVTTTAAATLITSTTVTLNGSVDPNGNSAFGFFRYATSNPGLCNNLFGTRAPASQGSDPSVGAGTTDVPYSLAISGLTAGTTYYYCALGRNTYGTTFGSVMQFTTLANIPVVTTNTPTLLTGTTAQLNGAANPGGAATTGWFRYAAASPGACNDSFGTRAPAAGGAALGTGTSSVPYSQGITGLTAGTTYYYCAIANNSAGTAVGSVLSFTTPTPPVAATTTASSVTNTSAYLEGVAIPNGSVTTGYFRYSATDPGTCDDVFGSRAPSSGGTNLGAGMSAVDYGQSIGSLSPATTYYFCAIASSFEGKAYGAVLSFTTASAPVTTTAAATLVTSTTATLNGSADPKNNSATGYFRYSTVDPVTCNDSFGTRAPSSGGTSLGSGSSPVAFSRAIASLTPGATYYYCAIASNGYGTGFGAVMSFTTLANPPVVTTNSATLLTGTTATLNASANPGGAATTGWFRYATTSPGACNDSFGTRAPAAGGAALGSGTAATNYSQAITGLTAGTTYYFCAIAENSVQKSFGSVVQFTTPTPPTVTTYVMSSFTNTTAYLEGEANPNGSATTGYFRFDLANPVTCNDSFGSRAPSSGGSALSSGTSPVYYNQLISGLSPGTTYYYCAIAQSFEGTSFGAVLSFTTPTAPTTTSAAATLVTSSTATMNGSADPNGNSAFGYFRYSATNPGVCSDSFGTRVPSAAGSDSSLGSGTTDVAFARALTGRTPGTTYYFCAIGRNTYGTTFGALLNFTTSSTAPTVSTNTASAVTTNGATLNGNATPNGAATTGWFRYATSSPGSCNDSFGTRAPVAGGSSLGAGTSGVPYAQAITGLTAGTTYYYCAIAQNSVGTSFGSVLTFTTTTPPTVATLAATPVTATTATLNATVNPNGFTTTGWFRYSTTNPVACDQVFGTATPTQSLGSGSSATSLAQALTSLSPATTYYFCAIATSSIGTTLGAVLSFTTPAAPPGVTTVAASDLLDTSATLNASVSPNGSDTTGWFRYSTTNPVTCNDSFGTRLPLNGGTALGSGSSPVPLALPATSLTAGTTYYFCAIASSAVGTSVGTVLSFTTAAVPTATTVAATAITSTGGTINGTGDPNGAAATGWFRYDTTNPVTCNDMFGTRAPSSGGTSLGTGTAAVPYSQALTGLLSGTTYYYCAIVSNAVGTTFGSVLSFTTAATPIVTTQAASGVTGSAATLNGSANPNLLTSTGWFRYSTTNPVTCTDAFGTRAPASGGSALGAGGTPVAYAQSISGLAASTTYYYCAIASNSAGTAVSSNVQSFTTAGPPVVTTAAATLVTNNSATLNGAANPNLATATGWFRYSTTNPGSCNDAFGTRAPSSGGTALGGGSAPVDYSQAVTGLTAGATYYYCAISSNSAGTGFGTVLTFTTLATPVVTSSAATVISSTGATLNGSGNPKLADATGWFRYSATNPVTCNDAFGTRAPASGGAALGSGNSAVAYSQAITGLTAGTTYYFCAIASNSVGTGFGSVLSFTTTAAPTATTVSATTITSSGATLNGSGDPNLDAATGWFRYSATDPGTCDDSFGTRAPASGGSSLGSGNSAVAYSQAITGLSSSTVYYYCAIVSNSVGTSFGAVLSFSTPAAPTVTTTAATAVTSTGATINGSANPNLLTSTGYFRYSATDPGTCNDSFGTRAPTSGGTALGAGSMPVAYSRVLTGLTSGTTYYYCAIASNSAGLGFGSVLTFTTSGPPVVTTVAATAVSNNGATLNGSANPNLATATGWFRYSTTAPASCNDVFGTRAPMSGGTALGAGSTPVDYLQSITGLAAGTTYYYCAISSNAAGTGFGTVMSFTTTAGPVVTTVAAAPVSSTTATLNGTANPKLADATGWFRFATTNPVTCNDAFGTRAPTTGGTALGAGNVAVPYSEPISGLLPNTTYFFCAIASNSAGTSFGSVMSFTTPAAPQVTTAAASAVTSTGATLNGSADPNGDAATGWFRYATIDPGTCDDSFGTRAPASGGVSLGSGTIAVAYTQALTGLGSGTTYYYCAIAENAVGKSFGAVASFTTTAAPTVATAAASSVTGTAATLNGSGNPNLATATGWFRYAATDPGTCNDSFGTRAPAAGGVALGAGSAAVPYTQAITGLVSGTTYYYCAIASNVAGTGFGAVMSFTTPGAPTVTSSAATLVATTDATLNGAANPNLAATTAWYRYATTAPASCNDAFGTRAPAMGGASLGAGSTAVDYSQALTGLMPGTTYYFCAIAENLVGKSFGSVLSFTTLAPPTVTTAVAGAVTDTSATLNGSANPKLAAATGWFRYDTIDPVTCNDSFGTRAPVSGGTSLGAGSADVPYTQAVTGLLPGTTYYFCAIADNGVGTGVGQVLSFTTQAVPSVTTEPPTAVLSSAALLNGSAIPNQAATTGWFRYDTVDPGTCDDVFGTRDPMSEGTSLDSGSTSIPYSQALSGLLPLTTYYYCAVAENLVGKSFGAVLSFTTSGPPVVTTEDATDLDGTVATLNASASPNLSDATGWFRFSDIDPVDCDDTFGTRAPATGGTALGAGALPVQFSEALADLLPGTTYYFCAIAENAAGVAFGEVLAFTTPADAPTVITSPATQVTSLAAKLNGSANPNGDAATGWFRYDTTDPGDCDDTFGERFPDAGGTDVGAGLAPVAFSETLTGLEPGVKYYFCAIAENAEGIGFGDVMSFVTGAAAPTVVTLDAAGVGSGATIKGEADPNGSGTTAWFRLGAEQPQDCDDSFGTRVPEAGGFDLGNGTTPTPFSQALTMLEPKTTYYFCAGASNMAGAAFGEALSFTTAAAPPVILTTAAKVTEEGEVTVNGAGNPRGSETLAWFRYDTTHPGECNDTFGKRAPDAEGSPLGDGREDVGFSEVLPALDPGLYYFCAMGSNEAGITFGDILIFEVPEREPDPEPEPEPDPETGADGGCGCRVTSDNTSSTASLSIAALLLLAFRRRRRRQ